MSRVRRRVVRWSIAGFAVAALCFAVPAALRWWVEKRILGATGLDASVDGLEVLWEPIGIALNGVTLSSGGADAPPLLTVVRIERPLRAGPLRVIGPLLRIGAVGSVAALRSREESDAQAVRLEDAEFVAPSIEIVGAAGAATPSASSVTLPDARIRELAVELHRGHGLVSAEEVELAGGELGGRVRFRAGKEPRIAAELRLTDVDVARLGALAEASGVDAGVVSGRLRYLRGGKERLRGRLAARGMRGSGAAGRWQIELGELDVGTLDVDLATHRFHLGRVAAAGGAITFDSSEEHEPSSQPPAAAWAGTIRLLEVRDLMLRSSEVEELPALRVVQLRGRDLGRPAGRFWLNGALSTGGQVRASGELDTTAPRFHASLELDRLELGPWFEPFESNVRATSGALGGRFEIWGPPGVQGRGSLRIEDLAMTTSSGERDLARLGRLEAELRGFTLAPRHVWLTSAEIEAPSLTLTRTADGLEPLSLVGAEEAETREGAARDAFARIFGLLGEAPPLDLPSIEVKARVRGGRLRFLDETVSPPFAVAVDDVDGAVAAWGGPPWGTIHAELGGRVDGDAPLTARADINGERLTVAGDVAELPLAPLSSYLGPALGYTASAGVMSTSFEFEWERGIRMPTRLALEGVVLERAIAQDRLAGVLGMPLERALQLMTDSKGKTELVLRLEGRSDAPGLGLIAALPTALREAVPEAVTVPLFEGAELVGGKDAEHVRLAPLSFSPGAAEIPPERLEVLERLAVILRWDPVLIATVAGSTGAEDAKALEHAKVPGDRLPTDVLLGQLAARRADAIRGRLVEGLGIAADRVQLAPTASGAPGVTIEIRPSEALS